MTESTGISAGG